MKALLTIALVFASTSSQAVSGYHMDSILNILRDISINHAPESRMCKDGILYTSYDNIVWVHSGKFCLVRVETKVKTKFKYVKNSEVPK